MTSNTSTSSSKNNHREKSRPRPNMGLVDTSSKEEGCLEIDTEGNFDLITKKLQIILSKHQGERQIVVIQDFPDPDALSSAIAKVPTVNYILWSRKPRYL